MAYRMFKDSRGTEWQTWDVVPRLAERRVADRRSRVGPPPRLDQRTRTDRRVLTTPRALMTPGLDGGWLCFEAPDEKRRLSPIPADWSRCTEERLEQYCAQATRARRSTHEMPAFTMDP